MLHLWQTGQHLGFLPNQLNVFSLLWWQSDFYHQFTNENISIDYTDRGYSVNTGTRYNAKIVHGNQYQALGNAATWWRGWGWGRHNCNVKTKATGLNCWPQCSKNRKLGLDHSPDFQVCNFKTCCCCLSIYFL